MRLLMGQILTCQLYSSTYRIGASLARQIATRPQTPARKASVGRWRKLRFESLQKSRTGRDGY